MTAATLSRVPDLRPLHDGSQPKVAIVHDYLTQRGGAERVVLSMSRAFPEATVHTTLYEPDETYPEFRDLDVRVSPLNHVPMLRGDHRIAMPLLPRALKRVDVGDADIVLASSSGWAHGVQAEVPVVVYCHNPPRWLHQAEDYTKGLSLPSRLALKALTPHLRRWDNWAAQRADRYIVNSYTVRERVAGAYGIDAEVVAPPVAFDPDGPQIPVEGIAPGYLLTVGRNRGYKATRVVADAVGSMPHERLVIVGDAPAGIDAHANVIAVDRVSDAELRWLYANAAALVAVAREDFGLTPPEANSMGVPTLVLRAGGYLDTTIDGVNGLFVDEATPDALVDGIARLRSSTFDPATLRRHAAQFNEASFGEQIREILREVLEGDTARLAA